MSSNTKNSLLLKALLYIGGLLTLNFIMSMLLPFLSMLLGLAITVCAVILMYRFGKTYRDSVCDSIISYGKAFSFLFQTYFLGAIVASVVMFFWYQFVNPEFLPSQTDVIMQMYKQLNIPVAEEQYQMLATMLKPLPYACLNTIGSAVVSAFFSLILAAFVKKEKPIF